MDDTNDFSENVNDTPSDEENKNGISADLIRGHINTIILRTLYERDKYGYEILEEIEKKSHGQYTLKQPTLYSALKRLESQGYINAYWKTDEISLGGRRKYYTLTDSGKEITERNQAEWEYSRTVIDNLISDRSFDFTQPPPASVDFKLLKKSTSRVPVLKDEDDESYESEKREVNEPTEQNEDKLPEIQINPETVIFKEQTVCYDSEPVIIPIEQPQSATAQVAENQQHEEVNQQASGSLIKEEIQQTSSETVSDGIQDPVIITATEEGQQQVATVRVEDIVQQPIAPVHINVIVQQPSSSSAETAQQQATINIAEVQEQAVDDNIQQCDDAVSIKEPLPVTPDPTDQLQQSVTPTVEQATVEEQPTEELSAMDEEQRRLVHENYMRLISEPVPEPPKEVEIVPASTEIDTEKLIYNNKPETERDYRNLINNLFDKTIKRKPASEPKPAPIPVERVESHITTVRVEDISTKAESDGLKVDTSDYTISTRKKGYNLGSTLFKSSLIISVVLLLEFMFALIFREDLGVNLAYPFVIFAIAAAQLLIFAILYYAGIGKNSRKPSASVYLSASIITTVIIIFIIFLVSLLIRIDFRSAGDIFAKLIIPILVALNIPAFASCFFAFTKFN